MRSVLELTSGPNDRAQAFLFRRQALAPTYAEKDVVRDFRYNACLWTTEGSKSAADYRLALSGLIADKRP